MFPSAIQHCPRHIRIARKLRHNPERQRANRFVAFHCPLSCRKMDGGKVAHDFPPSDLA
jgi:hypothetical protein